MNTNNNVNTNNFHIIEKLQSLIREYKNDIDDLRYTIKIQREYIALLEQELSVFKNREKTFCNYEK